jgi:hypothetical protein
MKFPRILFLLSSLLSLAPILPLQAQVIPLEGFAIAPASLEPVQPESSQPEVSNRASLNTSLQLTPPPLPSRGRPTGRQTGGASRGSCNVNGQQPLTAIVPVYPSENDAASSSTEIVFSLTAQQRPSFWFYVPYPLETTSLEFVLQDESNNTLYQEMVSGNIAHSSSGGNIVQVSLPETAPALEFNVLYHWFLVAYCDNSNPVFVDGWVEQQAPTAALSAALEGASLRDQALLYAQNSFWQDALTILGERYRLDSTDATVADDWKQLLEAADLDELFEQSIQ